MTRRPAPCPLAALAILAACAGHDTPPEDAGSPFRVSYGAWGVQDAPALARGPQGAWDSGLVDPGAMIYQNGRFHMLYNGIPEWPHPLSVGWATSTDGLHWERQSEAPVFAPDPAPFGGWTVRATSVVVENDRWILYFSVGAESRLDGVIGRATAASPAGPWTIDTAPVLEPGSTGSWDAGAVGQAKVLPDAGGYVMYYTGQQGGASRIGRAISEDGVRWTKDRDPVLGAPMGAEPPSPGVGDPTVVRSADAGWLMVYRASADAQRVGLQVALSGDGKGWTSEPGPPLIDNGPHSPFTRVYYSNLLATQTRQMVYFEAGGDGGTDVWLATRDVRVEARSP